ncbi:MAG: hypothetical protein IJZ30_05720 [Alphaproteobacteria bacterium]|nr:hypothetical protein [Alphaproteobacteria bacterium]
MKKIIFMLIVTLMVASCGNKSKEFPLINDLVVYTYEENDTLFQGVKYKNCDDVIINPDNYQSIEADSLIIKVTDANNRIWVFNHKGTSIGGISFDSFTKIKFNDEKGYYIGTNYDKSYYYFSDTKTFLAPSKVFINKNAMCFVVDNNLYFYTHEGTRLWKTPTKDITLLETTDEKNITFAVAFMTSDGKYTVYDINGKTFKTLTPRQWKFYQKSFLTSESISDFTYAEIETL